MRTRAVAIVVLSLTGLLTAQQPELPRPLPPLTPASHVSPADNAVSGRNLATMPAETRAMVLAVQRSAEWLYRANRPDGRFLAGLRPDLNRPIDDDDFISQATAATGLASAARYFQDERLAARARQAVLTLLTDTGPDPADAAARCVTLPPAAVNRLGAAAMVLLAIHELPNPDASLLDQGEQLARHIARQQRPDGSLNAVDDPKADPDAARTYPGLAAYALMRSQSQRPAAWKVEVCRRAMASAKSAWAGGQHPAIAAWQACTYAEAFAQSDDRKRDAAYGSFAFSLCDWLASQQYGPGTAPQWTGGFPSYADSKPLPTPPRADGLAFLLAFADGARAARRAPDVERYDRCRSALDRGLKFAASLQHLDSSCQHFAPGYRPNVVGGIHVTHHDGTIRSEDTAMFVLVAVRHLALAEP